MKSIKILAIIAAVLVVQLPWIYYVPFWVFDSLKTSVASKDVVGLSEIVNQMAVSESIWAGFYGGKKGSQDADGGEIDKSRQMIVDNMVSPDGLIKLLHRIVEGNDGVSGRTISAHYSGLNEFVIEMPCPCRMIEPNKLVFRRDKIFWWKLVAVEFSKNSNDYVKPEDVGVQSDDSQNQENKLQNDGRAANVEDLTRLPWNTRDIYGWENGNFELALKHVRAQENPDVPRYETTLAVLNREFPKLYGKIMCAPVIAGKVEDYPVGSEQSKQYDGHPIAYIEARSEDDFYIKAYMVGGAGSAQAGKPIYLCGVVTGRVYDEDGRPMPLMLGVRTWN